MKWLEQSRFAFSSLVLALLAAFFVPGTFVEAKVLYDSSKIGTSYDLFTELEGSRTGFLNIAPQYDGPLEQLVINGSVLPPGGGVAYEGTAEWFRVKRISGMSCQDTFSLSIWATDGTRISDGNLVSSIPNDPYCDFRIIGPEANRTNKSLWYIAICHKTNCNNLPSFVLDGSPENKGVIFNGEQTIVQPGGWAFQICDIDGCEGGFGTGSTSATTTDPGTGTTTATSTGASSVLFLPGIQASRLYTQENENENRLWEPNINADVEKLALDENGNSINQIYTRDVVDRVFGISSVYQTFINQMIDLRDDEKIIKDFTPFAYDWRFSVEDVVADGVQYENEIKNLVTAVETMAGDSFTKK